MDKEKLCWCVNISFDPQQLVQDANSLRYVLGVQSLAHPRDELQDSRRQILRDRGSSIRQASQQERGINYHAGHTRGYRSVMKHIPTLLF